MLKMHANIHTYRHVRERAGKVVESDNKTLKKHWLALSALNLIIYIYEYND